MELTHIEHLGIAVKSIEACLPYYEGVLGLKCYSIEEVADQKVKTAFFKIGQTKLELLEPTSEDSTIAKFIEKKGEGIHHIAFGVKGMNEAIKSCEQWGMSLEQKGEYRRGNGRYAYLNALEPLKIFVELLENDEP